MPLHGDLVVTGMYVSRGRRCEKCLPLFSCLKQAVSLEKVLSLSESAICRIYAVSP